MIKSDFERQCGCCGAGALNVNLHLVIDDPAEYRCDKHLGRLPCCIEGCGRTFKLDPGDSYDMAMMCGRHWRMAPKVMRDRVARIRRRARREGWTDDLSARHYRLWHMCRRKVEEGFEIDIAEIERLFG